jgi:seryl-tRNA synthetase
MRALRNFTLDIHISNGYVEVLPPIILNSDPLYGLGKLPKFEDDLFKLTNGQYLSATEELPLTAMFKNEILNEDELPIKLTSSSISFRSEAGSAGKDTRGVIRQHQFYNTELVIFDKPSNSMKTLEKMTHDAETILQQLNLPYRILNLCTGDLGIAATKTYDIEV